MTRSTSLTTKPDPQSIAFVPPVDANGVPVLGLRRVAAAKSLGISPRKLDELKAGGLIACVKLGSVVVYPVETLLQFLRDNSAGGDR